MKKVAVSLLTLGLAACAEKAAPTAETKQPASAPEAPPAPALKVDKGVDLARKLITLGALNDESGPAAAIGGPYAWGKRILVAEVNAGGSGILPEGWQLSLVEKDHGYDPAKSQQAYEAIKDGVLFLATSFGTPPTLPLRPFLEKDQVVAFPASLSSQMAEFGYTPPPGPSYVLEAMRAADWVAETSEKKAKLGIIHDQSDYGTDGLAGLEKAAAAYGMPVAVKRAVTPGQKDFTADVTELKAARVTHVLLTILPSSTGPVLGTAAKMQYAPVWIGQTPAWIDAFFAHPKLPPAVFGKFYWVSGMPYWGEKVPGMDAFLAAFAKHGGEARPDFYLLMSYLQGRIALEAAKRAIEAGDITRAGYVKALRSITDYTGGGLLQPIDLSATPYVAGKLTRILQPDFEAKTWKEVSGYQLAKGGQ